ncbi:hypothetical protein O0L34_g14699 [Tuta absoluta]|nr:hypothetical protein O0L34_g14699 [Tuta absoluta]
MDSTVKYLVLASLLFFAQSVYSTTYRVKIGTESHINVVDSRFLSFTVDPKYLFSSNGKYDGKESTVMAASLTPAFIRIAGPSTCHMTFHNSTITFTDLSELVEESREDSSSVGGVRRRLAFGSEEREDHILARKSKESFGFRKRLSLPTLDSGSEEEGFRSHGFKSKRQSQHHMKKKLRKETQELAVTHSQWNQFIQWTKTNGFDLVFALNNEEKTDGGLWDPNAALNIMTQAHQANIRDVYWQLGYECTNQSIDEYLNDLETLKAITESFTSETWRAVGGDVTRCLQADSKSDFRDYVTLSDDMMDAVVLNGNSSAQELTRMPEQDRIKLLQLLSKSDTPLWLIDSPQTIPHSELHRAADWMTSLGYSAKNGFAVHFRELVEEELFEPTLSFYMALLFKNLVGERVLNVDMEASEAVLFAHCSSLRHKPMPGAVTLYGANMDDEPARFAIKLSRREDGGDIMQFILGHDLNGNIIINGRPMYEGDIRPVVKRVRAYKTLLLNLPPKSFGFWVIANTKIEACHETEETVEDITKKEFVEALPVEDEVLEPTGSVKTKRSMIKYDAVVKDDASNETKVKEGLKEIVHTLSTKAKNVQKLFEEDSTSVEVLSRKRRQLLNEDEIESRKRKIKKYFKKKYFDEPKPRFDFLRNLLGMPPRSTRNTRPEKRKFTKAVKSRTLKRNTKYSKADSIENNSVDDIITADSNTKLSRKRRNVIDEKPTKAQKKVRESSVENEIFDLASSKDEKRLWKILHKIHKQIKNLSNEDIEKTTDAENDINSENAGSNIDEQFVVNTKMAEDGATNNFEEKSKHGILKSTIGNVLSVLADLNKNLNRFWNALSLFE